MVYAIVVTLLVFGVACVGLLAILALGINGHGLSRHLADGPRTRVEAVTRRVLGLTASNGTPDRDSQKERHINA
jgi:hypothetical protein